MQSLQIIFLCVMEDGLHKFLLQQFLLAAAAPAYLAGIVSAAAVVFIAVLGIAFSLIVSWGLSKTVLKGEASAFSLRASALSDHQEFCEHFTLL
ncbi:MAG: hypothetical protein MZV64_51915 [Ignavibacteriales bacterium]|nr:hypothetical protein [Ignavibacteriales bacterium]